MHFNMDEQWHRITLIDELEKTLLLLDYISTEEQINHQLRNTINQRIVDKQHLYQRVTGKYFIPRKTETFKYME